MNHKGNLERDCMLKFTKVKACQFTDLFKSINKSISMYKELSGRFGNVKVVFEEALNCHKSFSVERIKASLLKHFLQEHFAHCCRKLINKTSYTKIFIADNVLFGFKHLSNVKCNLCFLISSCEVLDVINNS